MCFSFSNNTHRYCRLLSHTQMTFTPLTGQVGERMLPRLQAFLAGKTLRACATALREFRAICDAIAGPNEMRRAEVLMALAHVVLLFVLVSTCTFVFPALQSYF